MPKKQLNQAGSIGLPLAIGLGLVLVTIISLAAKPKLTNQLIEIDPKSPTHVSSPTVAVEVSPSGISPTQQTTPTSYDWAYCTSDSDCKIVMHPCCPRSHNTVLNPSLIKDQTKVDAACAETPVVCGSAQPMMPFDLPTYCENNHCKVNFNSSTPTSTPVNLNTNPTHLISCQSDADCYDAKGLPIGVCEVPCSQTEAICDSGTCIRPMACPYEDCQ